MKRLAFLLLLLFTSAILLVLIGCSGSDLNHVTLWHQMRTEDRVILEAFAKKYERQHPGIKVEVLYKETEELRSSFQTAVFGGGGPDIVNGPSDQIGPFVAMGLIQPLDNWWTDNELSQIDSLGLVTMEGKLWAIGDRVGNHVCLVVNRKYVPTNPTSWEEIIELAKKNTVDNDGDGKIDRYGMVWNFTEPYFYIPFLTGFGGWVFDDKMQPSLNTDANIKAAEYVIALRDQYKVIPRDCDYNTADALFKEGRAAMILNGPWSWSGYLQAGIDIAIVKYPKFAPGLRDPAPMVAPLAYSVNANVSKAKRTHVKAFLDYLLSDEVQKEFAVKQSVLPTRITVRSDPEVLQNRLLQESLAQAAVGRPMPVVPELRAVWDAMRPSYQAFLGGSISASEAAKKMQSEAERKIQEMSE
ncbi:MAG: extracellular solute-binding protein [bacterium]|nr:extracellular solute-binding protein [bacterium]